MRAETSATGIRMFDIDEPGQGIVHVIGPELGLSLPGCLIVCGDSHTCTHGGLGALAFGIGSSELTHVLATQAMIQRRPKTMRVKFEGQLSLGVTAKDLILALIGHIGAAGGTGYAVEYAGSAIREMPVEGRLTICNLSIELGAKMGMIAPDEKTYRISARASLCAARRDVGAGGRGVARTSERSRRRLRPGSRHRCREDHPAGDLGHQPGTCHRRRRPHVPDPQAIADPARRAAVETALDYMGLKPGAPIAGTPVDWVFIGSCTNSRLSDLRAAAEVARGRKVAPGVRAWMVPGSETVKRDAVAEGLDRIFIDAGFEWREPGCSMCLAANGETVAPGQRSVSTSNRNFIGRQGPRARTHLASPATAAAAAIAGAIADVRTMER